MPQFDRGDCCPGCPRRLSPAGWVRATAGFAASLLLIALPAAAAERVVSAGGAITEIIYALGAESRLVAVDSTSQYPPAAESLPDIGYLRRLSSEPILALSPDLVLAAEDAGPPGALRQLRSVGVRVETLPGEPSPDGVIRKVLAVGEALGIEARAQALAGDLRERFAATAALRGREGPRVLCLLAGAGRAPLAAGRDTSAAAIIELAGGRNAIDDFSGYRPVTPEAILRAAPEVLLVPEHVLDAVGGTEGLLERPEIAQTPAARAERVVVMDTLLLLGFGPRTPQAIATLAAELKAGGN